MPTTPNQRPLPFADREVDAIESILPSTVQKLTLRTPEKSHVVEGIRECSVVHFACHGRVNSNPSQNVILLDDWETNPLKVADVVRLRLSGARFAYLSACETANNRNLSLLDEAIHMAGACQLAGFPTVIGTLWSVSDENSAILAEQLYRGMVSEGVIDFGNAARSLHFAIRHIRDLIQRTRRSIRPDDPISWAPYVHAGV